MKNTFAALVTLLGLVPGSLPAQVELQWTEVAPTSPVVDIRHAGDGSGRLFLVGLFGKVSILDGDEVLETPFLDLAGKISTGGEQGLLSLAFAPDYAESGYFYAWYTDPGGATKLSRFQVSTADPNRADVTSERLLLTILQPFTNHNGGALRFGPDGMLYVSTGDGGSGFDPDNNAQNLQSLLGKILRLDVDPSHGTYAIPADNPFVDDPDARDEIWAFGLRNPWRTAFDSATGDFYIGDVGQMNIEEINVIPAGSDGGQNFGWDILEGGDCTPSNQMCNPQDPRFTAPVWNYPHFGGSCSVTGGEVYRGNDYPAMEGKYIYGDYCSGRIWTLYNDGTRWLNEEVGRPPWAILTFGQDETGNVYVSLQGAGVFLLSDGPPANGFTLNPGLNDAWFNPATDGQGFFINLFPGSSAIFVGWFTFEVANRMPGGPTAEVGEPFHRWYTAIGTWDGNVATLDVFLTSDGIFDDPATVTVSEEASYGTLTIEFHDCSSATLVYDLFAIGLSGMIPIQRIVPDNDALCRALNEPVD